MLFWLQIIGLGRWDFSKKGVCVSYAPNCRQGPADGSSLRISSGRSLFLPRLFGSIAKTKEAENTDKIVKNLYNIKSSISFNGKKYCYFISH